LEGKAERERGRRDLSDLLGQGFFKKKKKIKNIFFFKKKKKRFRASHCQMGVVSAILGEVGLASLLASKIEEDIAKEMAKDWKDLCMIVNVITPTGKSIN
jgi:hypothetical protein